MYDVERFTNSLPWRLSSYDANVSCKVTVTMKKITIIMPFLNEGDEPIKTITSIYETAPRELFEIIAIDDASEKLTDLACYPEVRYVRNNHRLGVDGCRQLGADLARTPFLFIIDAHMRFKYDNWLYKIIESLEEEPETAWCTLCLGLGYGHMDIHRPHGLYAGATILFLDPDASAERPAREILEPKWQLREEGLTYELPCILGANYGFSKKWFDYIHGLKGLQMWGSSEVFLSLKTWLAGGKCKIRTDVAIGHKFRDNAPYVTDIAPLLYNKIFICKTLFPPELSDCLISFMPKDINFENAMKMINEKNEEIEHDRRYYQSIFTMSLSNFCRRFTLNVPKIEDIPV